MHSSNTGVKRTIDLRFHSMTQQELGIMAKVLDLGGEALDKASNKSGLTDVELNTIGEFRRAVMNAMTKLQVDEERVNGIRSPEGSPTAA